MAAHCMRISQMFLVRCGDYTETNNVLQTPSMESVVSQFIWEHGLCIHLALLYSQGVTECDGTSTVE